MSRVVCLVLVLSVLFFGCDFRGPVGPSDIGVLNVTPGTVSISSGNTFGFSVTQVGNRKYERYRWEILWPESESRNKYGHTTEIVGKLTVDPSGTTARFDASFDNLLKDLYPEEVRVVLRVAGYTKDWRCCVGYEDEVGYGRAEIYIRRYKY